jgi:SAM-dependent methyltransferase
VGSDSPLVMVVTSAEADDELHKIADVLGAAPGKPGGLRIPGDAIQHIKSAEANAASLILSAIGSAAFVVIQEPLDNGPAANSVAAAAAFARSIPVLVLVPDKDGRTTRLDYVDRRPRIVNYPWIDDTPQAWNSFWADVERERVRIARAYDDAMRRHILHEISKKVQVFSDVLTAAQPSEEVATAIAEVIKRHTDMVKLDDATDRLTFTFPFALYGELLSLLNQVFNNVRAIAGPYTERLKWDVDEERKQLVGVSERVFLIEDDFADQFGISLRIGPLREALRHAKSVGGQPQRSVSIARITPDVRVQLNRIVEAGSGLNGLDRFYAGDNMIGGYASADGARIRLVVYKDPAAAPYRRQKEEFLGKFEADRKFPPAELADDDTKLASWIYKNVLDRPEFTAIFKNSGPADGPKYARNYDGNILTVTPGYYEQVDALANAFRRTLYGLYLPPYEAAGDAHIKVLELGVGTGALTARILRHSAAFCREAVDPDKSNRGLVEIYGWDENPTMIEIAGARMDRLSSQLKGPKVLTDLIAKSFDPDVAPPTGKFNLVIGSLFSHYFMDSPPPDLGHGSTFTGPWQLGMFRRFLEGVRDNFLAPGGRALFLNAFYTAGQEGTHEQNRWRDYMLQELEDPTKVEEYTRKFANQFRAPTIDLVLDLARNVGFEAWPLDAFPGYPFKILVLGATS